MPAILEAGIIPTAVEFVEHSVLRSAERLLNKSWPTHEGSASLMLIVDGPGEDEIMSACERIAGVLEAHGALDVLVAEQKTRQAEIMEVRSMIYEALRPATVELFDICVPRSEITGHVKFVHELANRQGHFRTLANHLEMAIEIARDRGSTDELTLDDVKTAGQMLWREE